MEKNIKKYTTEELIGILHHSKMTLTRKPVLKTKNGNKYYQNTLNCRICRRCENIEVVKAIFFFDNYKNTSSFKLAQFESIYDISEDDRLKLSAEITPLMWYSLNQIRNDLDKFNLDPDIKYIFRVRLII